MANRTLSFVCCPLPVVSVSKKTLDFRICGTFPKRLQMGICFWGAFLLLGYTYTTFVSSLFASICFFILDGTSFAVSQANVGLCNFSSSILAPKYKYRSCRWQENYFGDASVLWCKFKPESFLKFAKAMFQ